LAGQIKEKYPDDDEDSRKEKTIKILNAYRIIMNYCEHYRFLFSKEEVEKYMSPEELWAKQFGKDPIWGTYQDDEQD
jgi:hypothetical protein